MFELKFTIKKTGVRKNQGFWVQIILVLNFYQNKIVQ